MSEGGYNALPQKVLRLASQKRRALFKLLKIFKDETPDKNFRTASLQKILPEEAETTALAEPKKKLSFLEVVQGK